MIENRNECGTVTVIIIIYQRNKTYSKKMLYHTGCKQFHEITNCIRRPRE